MPFNGGWITSSSPSPGDEWLSEEGIRSLDRKFGSSEEKKKKKLDRQRKLRHATDDELGLKSSTPSGFGDNLFFCGGHWSNSAVPQPLPLPETNSGDHPRRSSNVPHQSFGKTTTYVRRGFPSGLTIDTPELNYSLHFPAKSAPSSPNLSPQRDSPNPISDGFSAPNSSPTSHPSNGSIGSRNRNGVLIHSADTSLESCLTKVDINNTSLRHPLPLPPPIRKSIDRPDNLAVKHQWQKGRLIGHGTYGNVYLATHRETGATCAVKEVEMILDDPKCVESIKQLEQEMKFLRDLRHPNIVQYYGCETINDRFCIYLEYVHPGPIDKYVRENCGVMTENIVRSFTRHILSGLAYLHSKKTIHRDIKGANLLVNASGVVKLADFGLAKHLAGHNFDLSLKGTPHWIAPEVLRGAMPKDASPELACGVDIWSLGCTVIEMFTGKPPWSEFNEVQAMFNLLNKPPPIPENLSAEGKDFLQRCFQMSPADRPSAANLLEHPFLRSSKEHHAVQEFSGRKLNGTETPSESSRTMMQFPSVMKIQNGNLPLLNVETSQQCSSYLNSPDADPLQHHFTRNGGGSHVVSPQIIGRSSSAYSIQSILIPRVVPRNLLRSSYQRKA